MDNVKHESGKTSHAIWDIIGMGCVATLLTLTSCATKNQLEPGETEIKAVNITADNDSVDTRRLATYVHQMPGMENGAPERTDTSSGSDASPSFLPQRASRSASAATISSSAPSGHTLPAPEYSTQVWQVMVKPPGTGRPMRLISARFAPLPPSTKFMDLSPSVTQVPWASVPKR